ncbi:DinB family protein [Paenibacillus sp. JSM ZJ436]|uniref:DinB family protein n=1 Tax=Paenibacillus sp. JSM ZJ436 TaxID=3376190 RepID=UPI0037B669E6
MQGRPQAKDYPEYYEKYIGLIQEPQIVEVLAAQQAEAAELFGALNEDQANGCYEEGKWTVKEVFGHIFDHERLLSYWLYRFARGDAMPLTSSDRESFVKLADYKHRELDSMIDEYKAVRQSTIQLLKGLPEEAWERHGFAGEVLLSVRAMAYIIAGHEKYHLKIIRERYLS